MRRYLAYRVASPLIVGTASTLVGYPLIGITPLPFASLLVIAAVAGVSAPLLALVLASAAPNKVAGFAVVKVLNGVNLPPIAAFFLPQPLQYIAGDIPTYWPMRALWSAAAGESYFVYLAIGAIAAALAPGFTFAASAANQPVPITSGRGKRLGIMSLSGTSRVATSVPSARGTRMCGACAPTTGSTRWQDV